MKLVDTNVLVYAHDRSSPKQPTAAGILREALSGTTSLCVAPQILLEFYNIMTNPRRIAHPLSAEEAGRVVGLYLRSPRIGRIHPDWSTLDMAIDLCLRTNTEGADVFDAFLAATALGQGIREVYTENVADLARFGMISINPFA